MMKRFKYLFESPPDLTEPGEQTFTRSEHGPKKKKVSEQYREEGRFKPTIPRYVKSKGVGPRPQVDSAKVKLKEDFGKPTPSVEEVAKKHGVSVDEIESQLKMGIKVEKEHTNDSAMAREIALDHLNEKPNYYTKLKKYVEMTDMEYQSAGTGAKTLIDKPNKEPIKKFKSFNEDLRQWFDPNHPKGGWKRINAKGEAIGPCAREPGEAKPKCMSNEKRASLTKKERASAVSAKRRHDPDPERKGKPINVSNFGKGKLSEEMEQLDEKNQPTNPELWSRAKSLARSKFDVYPSAYANGWAAKWYKSKGGGWKSVSEEVEQLDELSPATKASYKEKAEKEVKQLKPFTAKGEYKDLAKNLMARRQKGLAMVKEQNDTTEKNEMVQSQLHFIKYACEEILEYIDDGGKVEEWYQVKVAKAFSEFESLHAFVEGESRRTGMKEAKENVHDAIKKIRKEEVEHLDELSNQLLSRYKDAAVVSHNKAEADKNYKLSDKRFSGVVKATNKQFANDRKKRFGEEVEKDNAPFEGGTKRKEKVIPGKYGAGYSTARHLARQALKKQVEKMKPVKESLEESRKAEIVKEIMKKKKNESNSEKFNANPELSSEITKA